MLRISISKVPGLGSPVSVRDLADSDSAVARSRKPLDSFRQHPHSPAPAGFVVSEPFATGSFRPTAGRGALNLLMVGHQPCTRFIRAMTTEGSTVLDSYGWLAFL